MIEDALRLLLLADSRITAVTTTIRPVAPAQRDKAPFIYIEVPNAERTTPFLKGGVSAYRGVTARLLVVSKTFTDCQQLSDLTRKVLDGFYGRVREADVKISSITLDGEDDIEQGNYEGEPQPIYLREMDYRVFYKSLS